MLVAAAVCPCAPLVVPEVAAGAAPELDGLRAACTQALDVLAQARPDRLVVVGPVAGSGHETYPQGARGSFRGFGVAVDVLLGKPPADPGPAPQDRATEGRVPEGRAPEDGAPQGHAPERSLPPSLAVAAWLLDHAGRPSVPVTGLAVGELLAPERCAAVGAALAAGGERLALLVAGDGSACRSLKAPGYFDERAAGFDAEVAHTLATADVAALEALDDALAGEVRAAGRAAWQVLAGAAKEADLRGTLLHDDAPYGVGYLVAAWS